MDKIFLFLYPHTLYFNDCRIRSWTSSDIDSLNDVLTQRYRAQGWSVGFVHYNNWPIDSRVRIEDNDLCISDGQDVYNNASAGEVRRKVDDNLADIPSETVLSRLNQAYLMQSQLQISQLRVGGFHMQCTESLAKVAYESGINVVVDEVIGSLFHFERKRSDFVAHLFPGYDRLSYFREESRADEFLLEKLFAECAAKPWMYDWRQNLEHAPH